MKTKTTCLVTALLLAKVLSTTAQPVISTQPQSQTNVVGSTVVLLVEATGTPPLYYQWRFNAVNRAGATNATLVITNVQPSHQGNYTVVVTNVDGAVTSTVARLSVLTPPAISTQPADQSAVWGDIIQLRVVATGTAPLSYQWYHNAMALLGRTNASLTLTNVTFSNAGPYFVVVTNTVGAITSRIATLDVPAPAALDPKLSANIRLGDDPPQLPANLRAQVEPHIARDYYHPELLVATFQEGRYENGAAAAGGYSISTNGGLTWTRSLIPRLTRIDGGPYYRAADSVAACDLEGNLYLSHVVFENSWPPPTATVISRSTDLGQTFGAPQLVFSARPETDKSWIAINTFPASPTANRLVVMCNVFGDGRDQLRATYSDDRGATWSPAQLVGPAGGVFCQQFFLPDGSLGVVYFHYLNNIFETFADARIEFMLSGNGGETFGSPVVITPMTGMMYHDPIARDAWDVPSACTDRQRGVIYVTYQALIGPASNRVPSIMFTRSVDRGQSWSTPVAVNDTPFRRGVFNPCIAVSPDGQHVMIAFYDKRHQTTNSADNLVDYYLAESFDGGETWQANLRLTDVSSDLRKAPLTGFGRMLADYQGMVSALNSNTPGVAIWIDTRTGNPDPFVVRIDRTQGTTFETWQKLRFSTNDVTNPALSGESADPDDDGIPNLAEYAFGFEPGQADPPPVKIAYDRRYFGLHIFYERLAALSDLEFHWETSTNLVNWVPAVLTQGDGSIQMANDPSKERVIMSFEMDVPVKFFRLGMTRVEH